MGDVAVDRPTALPARNSTGSLFYNYPDKGLDPAEAVTWIRTIVDAVYPNARRRR